MFLLGFDFEIIDFSYKESVFSTKPTAKGFEVKLHSGSLNTKWDYYGLYASQNFIFQAIFSPQIVSLTFNEDNGSSNLNVIPKENKIVSLSLKFLGRII